MDLLKKTILGPSESVELFSTARQLGISAKSIRNQLKTWRMNVQKTASGELLIPKAGLIKLIKILDTPACWAAYDELWADAHELEALRPQLEIRDRIIAELQARIASLVAPGTQV